MSLEELAEKYSKKWGISLEEAKKKAEKFLEEKPKPADRTKSVPGPENLFPEPLGPLSQKVQDINQAALSTAFTRKSLFEMNQSPEEIKNLSLRQDALKEKVESVETRANSILDLVNTTVKEWKTELETKRTEEERQKLLSEMEEKMIKPLKSEVESMKTALENLPKGGTGGTEKLTELEDTLSKIEGVTESAKSWLRKIGYPVENLEAAPSVELKGSAKELTDDYLRKTLESRGYKMVGGPMSYDQIQKLMEEERKKAQEEVLDDKRIDAVADIIKESVKDIIEMFKPAVNIYTEYMFSGKGGQSSKEQSVSQEK